MESPESVGSGHVFGAVRAEGPTVLAFNGLSRLRFSNPSRPDPAPESDRVLAFSGLVCPRVPTRACFRSRSRFVVIHSWDVEI